MNNISVLKQIAEERKTLQDILDKADAELFERELAIKGERLDLDYLRDKFKVCDGFPSASLIESIMMLSKKAKQIG